MTPSDAIDVSLLEPLLREFVRLIGLEATMAIVEKHGGTLLSIPRKAGANEDLVALIGADKAAILGKEYGGERPLIPKALDALRDMRDRQIREQRERYSMRELARRYRLGERRIRQITSSGGDEPPVPPPQARLFD